MSSNRTSSASNALMEFGISGRATSLLFVGHAIADQFTRALAPSGIAIDVLACGGDALSRCTSQTYDAVVVTSELADMHGHVLIGQLRAGRHTSPILMISPSPSVEDAVRALSSGADDYLDFPFHADELVARLAAIRRRTEAQSTPPLTCGDLQFDLGNKRVLAHGQELRLTPKEYGILEFLVLREGRLQSRKALLAHLCGEENISVLQILHVYISRIRRKLSQAGISSPTLITSYGAGYQLLLRARPAAE